MELAAIASVLAAMGGLVKLILSHLEKREASFQKSMAEQRSGFEHFLGNHMSSNTRALERMADSVEKLADRVDGSAQ